MNATILKPIKVRSTGETFLPGQVVDLSTEKIREWEEKGLVTRHRAEPLPEKVAWTSPLFGRLEAGPILEMGETTFSLIHPLTGERVTLSREWLASLDERSSIMEHGGGLPREEADREARVEFFRLFRKGGSNAERD